MEEENKVDTICYNVHLIAPWKWEAVYICGSDVRNNARGRTAAEALQACQVNQAEEEGMDKCSYKPQAKAF